MKKLYLEELNQVVQWVEVILLEWLTRLMLNREVRRYGLHPRLSCEELENERKRLKKEFL